MAAGVTLDQDKVPAFREMLNAYARAACPDMPAQAIRLDCRLRPQALSAQLPKDLGALEPFGNGNPQPLFGLMGMELREVQPVGGGSHLRLAVARDGCLLRCMRFGVRPEDFPFAPGDRIDLAVTLEAGVFRGEERLEITARDVRPSGLEQEACIRGLRLYGQLCRGEPLGQEGRQALVPSRDQLAALYRLLAARKGRRAGLRGLLLELGGTEGFGLGRLLVCLDILQERKLICCEHRGEVLYAQVLPTEEKVDIFASPVYKRLG